MLDFVMVDLSLSVIRSIEFDFFIFCAKFPVFQSKYSWNLISISILDKNPKCFFTFILCVHMKKRRCALKNAMFWPELLHWVVNQLEL